MTLMRVAAARGRVLTYDTDDAENVKIETPNVVVDVTKPGQAHLVLTVDFKDGKRPLWLTPDEAETARKIAEGRKTTQLLEQALREELVPPHIVQRIMNRFMFGHPDGLNGSAFSPDARGYLMRQQRRDILDAYEVPPALAGAWDEIKEARYPAGQSAAERTAAMLKDAGFTPAQVVESVIRPEDDDA